MKCLMASGGLVSCAAALLVAKLIASPALGVVVAGVDASRIGTAMGNFPSSPIAATAPAASVTPRVPPIATSVVRTPRGEALRAASRAPQVETTAPRTLASRRHFNWLETYHSNETTLARIRGALGCERLVTRQNDLLLTGGVRRQGDAERLTVQAGRGGRYLVRVEGAGTLEQGFDGSAGWSQARTVANNVTVPLTYGNLQLPVWIQTGWWLAPGSPIRATVDQKGSDSRQLRLKLSVSNGDRPAILNIDRRTHRPVYLQVETTVGNETWLFNDYRQVDGQLIPHRLVYVGVKGRDIFQIQSATLVPNRLQAKSGSGARRIS